ncbi:mitogen-activated protein kinase kinase kinase 19 [Rhinoderma darwinii]|uniref:mitogen-activated protein kinase kinase kinase 19 n=1 Tax=Rhinoderma darwinii TaxID=43563 RepID=UPI003F66C683
MMMMEEAAHDGELILPFLEAVTKGDVEEIVRNLNIDPRLINTPHPETGNTALIVAAGENRSAVIALLLEHGADVTFCNSAQWTAVHAANDGARAQLLSAVTRTTFPQLSMIQAAWQGDLERIQHLLSTDHGQYVDMRNGQGLTPVMLVLRDVDLFDSLTMESEYKPVAVLQELLKHHADADLLDSGGRSAVNYVSEMKSPLRQQLTDALEGRAPPPADAQDEAFCDLCPDTKDSLCDTPPAGRNRSAIQKESSEESSSDGIPIDLVEKNVDPSAELGAWPDLQEEVVFQEMENFHQMQRRRSSRQWFTDPPPEHSTPQSTIKRHPSLPPLHIKTGEGVSKLERLGVGHLVQESYSEPNILQCHFDPNPLRDIKYIKGHIWQRLGSAESSRDSKTFPPLSHSPRCPMPTRLRPLSKTSLRIKETNISRTGLRSDKLANLRVEGSLSENELQNSLRNSEDIVLSRDLVQISLDSCVCSEREHSHRDDRSSKTEEDRSRMGSGRNEIAEHLETARIHKGCRDLKPLLHSNDEAQSRNCVETATSLHIEQLHEHGEGFRKHRLSEMEKEDLPGTREDTKLELHDKIRTIEENLWTTKPTNEDTKKRAEPVNVDSLKTPRTGYIPFVHITFSEQEPEGEVNYFPSKHLFTKRKAKAGSLLHNVNHSFNVLAHKENEKTTKHRKTSMSAPDNPKHHRPLSNSNRPHGKSVPLPTLVYSSVPSPSKVSKKVARLAQGSTDRSSQRSQTQLSLYSQKSINSPSNTPILSRSKSSHDFQNFKYSDMCVEITSQQGDGPVMYPPTIYVDATNLCRETNSASSTRSCSSKGSRASSSRDSSARSKRPKQKNKKSPSATSQCRNSSSKQEVIEKVQNKTENMVIISGVDWEIKTRKQDGDNYEVPLNGMMDTKHQNFELSTINEATIENSITINGTVKETLKTLRELVRSSSNVESYKPENGDQGLLQEVSKKEGVQQDIGHRDTDENNAQAPKIESATPPQDLNAAEKSSQLGDWVKDDPYQSETADEPEDHADSTSQNIHGSHSLAGSEHLTADLISCLENLILIDEESTGSLVDDRGAGEQSKSYHETQDLNERAPPYIQKASTNPSLTDQNSNTNNSNPTANQPGLNHNERSIHWIKGEVLGKGAYGTVYRGLTSQGKLIAAKQVTLHGSDPAVAEKEYKKLQEEVDLLKTLKHVNIVGYLGTAFEDTVVTIFMEYVPGGSISSILRHFGPLQEVVMSRYTSHILQGISYLHKNRVVHRDIKGNNVMLMSNGVIKLIDFGCAKRLNGLSINGTHGEMLQSMHGTPYWMAPEVISESGHGEKSDIWSIGCTVFEMATGKPPLAHMERMAAMFYIGVEKGLMPTLPDHFTRRAREFVNLCLTRDQETRPSAEQLLQHHFVRWISNNVCAIKLQF